MTENSPTRGAPGPATGIPVSPWSHTVAASASESTECIAAQATAACSFSASAGVGGAGPRAPRELQHRGGGVEVGGAPCHAPIPAPTTDTQAPKTGFSTGVRETFSRSFSTRRRPGHGPVLTRPTRRRGLDRLDHRGLAWSRRARPPRCWRGLDRLDHRGAGVVSTGSTTEGWRGLDGLDHRGWAWSRQARPPRAGVVSTGSTTEGGVVSTGSTTGVSAALEN